MSTTASDFYVVGGTLRRDAPSYVKRKADDDLYDELSAGRFCYVLTSRQMGKSSLMVRTAVRLRADEFSVAVLDLTAVGHNVTAEQWYEGLLSLVGQQLDLEDVLEEFWLANKRVGILQRWMRAIREVVMAHRPGRIVIFVDEIDAVRSLPFSTDEFFAGIREFHNWRTEDDELMRLTFCLLGVATPSDLIRDTRTTPFNIGRRIELTDFTEEEAAPLVQGLGRDEGLSRLLLRRVLYWTGGHPYLTQRLCQSVADDDRITHPRGVDRLCEEIFLSSRARERDDNLLFVRERMLRSEEVDRAGLLDLYRQVWKRKRVADDEANTLISVLRLSGITRPVDGYLRVRNQIYYRVFDDRWVLANMPDAEVRRQRAAFRQGLLRAAAVAAVVLTLMAGLVLAALYQRNVAREERSRADKNAEQLRVALATAKEQQLIAEEKSKEAERQRQIAVDKSNEAEQQRRLAEDKSREAAASAARAESALRVADEQRVIAERNLRSAQVAKEQAEAQQKIAERNEQAARESERRLRTRSIDNNNLIYYLATTLEQISPVKERPRWRNIKGDAQIQLRNYEAAISELSAALIDDPDNLTSLASLSYLYYVNKQPEMGIANAEAALRINPNAAVASLNLALSLSAQGRYQDAESSLRRAIRTFKPHGAGEYPQSYVSPEIEKVTGRLVINADRETALTAFHYELSNMNAAAGGDGFEASLAVADSRPKNVNAYLFALNWAWIHYEQRPQDFGALAAQGALWERAGYVERALDAYNDFQKQYRGRPSERRYDSLARWVTRRIGALQDTTPRAPLPEQLDARELYLRGRESLFSDKSDTLNFWTQAIEKDPGNVGYLIERAGLFYDRDDFIGTRLDSNAVLSLAPDTPVAHLYRALANVSDDLNAPREVVIEDVKRAKDLDATVVPGSNDRSLDKLSRILAQNDINEAIDLLERVTRYSYPSPRPYLLMARLLNERQRYKEALEKLKIASALTGFETELYDERRRAEEGLCKKKEGQGSTCMNQVEIVLRQASAYKGFGDALRRQGKTGEALDIYIKSLRLLNDITDTGLPEIRRDISVTLSTTARLVEEQGTKAKAIEYLEAELGGMNNLKSYLADEIKRLSNSP